MGAGVAAAAMLAAGIGASLYGDRKDRRRNEQNRAAIEAGYNRAGDITRGGFAGARDIYSATYPKIGEKITSGFGKAGQQIGAGYTKGKGELTAGYDSGRQELAGGYDAAKDRLEEEGGSNQTAGQEIYGRLLGKGGFSPEMLANMKTNASETYGAAGRDIVRYANPWSGGAGRQGLTGEQMAGDFSQIARDRAGAMRDIDIENAMLQEEQQTSAIGAAQERERYAAEMDIGRGRELSELDITRGGQLADMSVDEAVRQGTLTAEQAQILAQLEADYGINMADLTLGEAEALAQQAIGQTGSMVAQNQRPNVWGQIGAGLLNGASLGSGFAAGQKTGG